MSRPAIALTAIAATLVLTVTGMVGISSAWAHSNRVSSTPAADAVVETAPEQVTVEFDADLIDVGTAIIVRSDTGTTISTGDPIVRRASIAVSTDPAAPPGRYTVAYRVLSKDGHPITASFTYTVAGAVPSDTARVTASAAASSAADAGADVPDGPSTPAASTAHGDDSGGAPVLGIAIAVVILGLLAVIGAVALKR